MRKTIAFALLALAACDKGPQVKVENATPAEVARQVEKSGAADTRLQPGQWRITSKLSLMDAQGLPTGAAEQMRRVMERTSTDLQCITPEQVSKPNSEIFAGRQNSHCTYDRFEMGGGKISAALRCPGAEGQQMRMTMEGSYAPTSYTVNTVMDMQSPAQGQKVKMAMSATGARIGECPAGGAASGK